MRSGLMVFTLVGAWFLGLSALQAGDAKVQEVGKGGLELEGQISDNDLNFKFVPLPNQTVAMLPGKVFEVKLSAGKRYRIALKSKTIDTVLVVKDATDKQLAWDDDSGGDLNSLLFFDPAKDGTYKVYALALKDTGAFTLLIREAVVHEVGAAGLSLKGNLGKSKTGFFAYNVKLDAGKTYVIDMVSPNPKVLDPFLTLQDPAGKKVAEDDDSGGDLNARISYRAPTSGIYRIVCSSYENRGRGPYQFSVRVQK